MTSVSDVSESSDTTRDLTPDQRAWLVHSEALWRKAHVIVSGRPDLDVGDVYHDLRPHPCPSSPSLRLSYDAPWRSRPWPGSRRRLTC
jgi:hypothetical protein